MKERICYVVGAGENYGFDFQPVTGDFDTLKCIPKHPNTIVLSAEKDDTDTLAAVREGIKAGYTSFHIYCGTGGRIDHTLAKGVNLRKAVQKQRIM